MIRSIRPIRFGIAVTVTTLALAACTDQPDEPRTASAGTGAAAATADDGPGDDAVEVGLVDFGFEGLPDTVPAGTRLTVDNRAEAELHELVAFRLPDDEERAVADLAGLAPGDLIAALGEPVTVLLATPGGDPIPAVGDGTLAEPGRYAIMCFIPTGVEPDVYLAAAAETDQGPPQIEGAGPPHFVHGMYAELVVE
jgi:hypothetical protein